MLEPRVLLSAAPIDAPGDLIAADPELSTIEVVEESVLHENAQTPAEEALAPVVSGENSGGQEALFEGVETSETEPSSVSDSTLSSPAKETEEAIENAVSGAEESQVLLPVSEAVLDAGDEVSPLPNEAEDFTNQDVQVPENKGPPGSEVQENELLNPDFSTNSNGTDGAVTDGSVLENSPVEAIDSSGIGLETPSGPLPELPGLVLTAGSEGASRGQVFFLQFEGAENVSYRGPVPVSGLTIPEFGIEGLNETGREVFLDEIVAALNELFGEAGVTFTKESPTDVSEFSTVFVGGTDDAFSDYGSFLGLAEQVDVGNVDHSDNALVFAESIWRDGMTAEAYAEELTRVIAEEAGHLVGYAEADPVDTASPIYSTADAENKILDLSAPQPDTTDDGRDFPALLSFGVNAPGVYGLVLNVGDSTWSIEPGAHIVFSNGTTAPLLESVRQVNDGGFIFDETIFSASVDLLAMGTYTATFEGLRAPATAGTSTLEFELYSPGFAITNPANRADFYRVQILSLDRSTPAAEDAYIAQRAQEVYQFINQARNSPLVQQIYGYGMKALGLIEATVFDPAQYAAAFANLMGSIANPSTNPNGQNSPPALHPTILSAVQDMLGFQSPNVELELGVALQGDIDIGAALPGVEFTTRSAELLGALKVVWAPSESILDGLTSDFGEGKIKFSRVVSISIGVITLEAEEYIEFGDTASTVLAGNLTDSSPVTFGMAIAIKPSVSGTAELGEFLNLFGTFTLEGEGTLKIEKEMSVGNFLALYESNGSFVDTEDSLGPYEFSDFSRSGKMALAVADVLFPFYADGYWETALGKAMPLVSPIDLLMARPDSMFSLLTTTAGIPVVKLEAGINFVGQLGGSAGLEATAIISIQAGAVVYVQAALKGTVTVLDTSLNATYYSPLIEQGAQFYGVILRTTTTPGFWDPGTLEIRSVERFVSDSVWNPSLVRGVTVVTHGFQPLDGSDSFLSYLIGLGDPSSPGDSLYPLAAQIQNLTTGWLIDYDIPDQGELGGIDYGGSIFPGLNALQAAETNGGIEVILLFDWAAESNEFSSGWTEAAGEALVALLTRLGLLKLEMGAANPFPYHFIGHSFGAAVTSEAVRLLAAYGVTVDHLTYLDPHDFDQTAVPVDGEQDQSALGTPDGYGAAVWENVVYAETYFQTRTGGALNPQGRPIPGAFNVDLSNEYPISSLTSPHSWIWSGFYLDTVADASLDFGYYWSRVGNDQGDLYSTSGVGLRPEPRFYNGDQAIDGQGNPFVPPGKEFLDWDSHNYTPDLLVDHSTGFANVSGLASLGLTAAQVRQGKWAPERSGFDFAGGDFSGSGGAYNTVAGWSHHGGGGSGQIFDLGGGNYGLSLTSANPVRVSNFFYIPENAGALMVEFPFPLPGGSLSIYYGDYVNNPTSAKLLGSVTVTNQSRFAVVIPAEYRGQVGQFSLLGSNVVVDNVRPVSGGFNGDLIEVDLSEVGQSREGPGVSFDIVSLSLASTKAGVASTALTYAGTTTPNFHLYFGNGEIGGTVIYSEAIGGAAFADTGEFLFAASYADGLDHDLDPNAPGYQGLMEVVYSVNGMIQNPLYFFIGDGYSSTSSTTNLPSTAVGWTGTPPTNPDRLARLQQRLLHLGFGRGLYDEAPVLITGTYTGATEAANDLFITSTGLDPNDFDDGQTHVLIDRANAPQIVVLDEMAPGGNPLVTLNWGQDVLEQLDSGLRQTLFGVGSLLFNPFTALQSALDAGTEAVTYFATTAGAIKNMVAKTVADIESTVGSATHVVAKATGGNLSVTLNAATESAAAALNVGAGAIDSVLEQAENVWLVLTPVRDAAGDSSSLARQYLIRVESLIAATGELVVDWASLQDPSGSLVSRDQVFADALSVAWSIYGAIQSTVSSAAKVVVDASSLADPALALGTKYLVVDNTDLGYDRQLAEDIITALLAPALTDRNGTAPDDDGQLQPVLETLTGAFVEVIRFNDPRLWHLGNVLPGEGFFSHIKAEIGVPDEVKEIDRNVLIAVRDGLNALRDKIETVISTVNELSNTLQNLGNQALDSIANVSAVADTAISMLQSVFTRLELFAGNVEESFTLEEIRQLLGEAASLELAEFTLELDLLDFEALEFRYTFTKALAPVELPIDLSLGGSVLGFSGDTNLTFTPMISLSLVAGIGDLNAEDLLDEFYAELESLVFSLELANTTPVTIGANIGPLGVDVNGGSIIAGATLAFQLGRVTGQQVLNSGFSIPAPNVSRTGTLDVVLPMSASFGTVNLTSGGNPVIRIADSNLFDLVLPTFATEDFDSLFAFSELTIGDYLQGLRELFQFIADTVGQSEAMSRPIPVLGRSINEIFDFADRFLELVDDLENGGVETVQQLESTIEGLLGLSPDVNDVVTLSYDELTRVFLLDFDYEFLEVVIDSELNFNLAELLGYADADSDTAGIVDLEEFAGVTAEGSLTGAAGLTFQFGFGLDLSNPTNPIFFLQDDAVFAATLGFSGVNLNLTAYVGPLEVTVQDGYVRFDIDGDGALNDVTVPAQRAIFSLSLASNGGRYTISQLASLSLVAAIQGGLKVDLPMFLQGLPLGDANLGTHRFIVEIADLSTFLPVPQAESIYVRAPDFASYANNFNFDSDLEAIVFWLTQALDLIADVLDGEAWGIQLPFIGEKLKDQADFVRKIRNEINDFLTGHTQTAALIAARIYELLGPDGLDIVKDHPDDGNNTLGPEDVIFNLGPDGVLFDILLGQDIEVTLGDDPETGEPIFDVGLPGLNLELNAELTLQFGWGMRFGFGVDGTHGFYINTNTGGAATAVTTPGGVPIVLGNDEIYAYLRMSLAEDSTFSGNLLFLNLDITDNGSVAQGTFAVDLKDPNDDGFLTLAEITSGGSVSDFIAVSIELSSVLDLHAKVSAGAGGAASSILPSLVTDIYLEWNFSPGDGGLGSFDVQFNNVGIDLGRFVSDFIGPIFSRVQQVLEPIRPVIDLLTTRIPVLSDIDGLANFFDRDGDGEVWLIELAPVSDSTLNAILTIARVALLIDSLPTAVSPSGDLIINVGSFSLGNMGSLRNSDFDLSSLSTPTNTGNSGSFLDQLDGANLTPGASDFFGTLFDDNTADDNAPASATGDNDIIKFPILKNPALAFDFLLGKEVDLFVFDLPEIIITPPPLSLTVNVVGPIAVQFGFSSEIRINLVFGYDTAGIRSFAEGADGDFSTKGDNFKQPAALLDGFYVSDNWDENDQDQPEVVVELEVTLGAGVSLGIIEIIIGGAFGAEIAFDLVDGAGEHGVEDGKIRARELAAAVQVGCFIETSGKFTVGLFVQGKVGPFKHRFDLAEITLADFDTSCDPPASPELGTLEDNGTLTLHMGPRAGDRDPTNSGSFNSSDGHESFEVVHVGGESGSESVEVRWNGYTQQFDGVRRIVANGGAGNDSIVMAGGVLSAGNFRGGIGNDQIIGSRSASNAIYGEDGNDVLVGGDRSDFIYGGLGNDKINGNDGIDLLYGDDGNDEIYGNAGGDVIRGGAGSDVLVGGSGNDFIDGELGPDEIYGDEGDDDLHGGAGIDELYGGRGNDEIYGDDDDDMLFGDEGDDILFGGAGNDLIYGDDDEEYEVNGTTLQNFFSGSNYVNRGSGVSVQLVGATNGNDVLVGGAGVDVLVGGPGNDLLVGGDDTLPTAFFAGLDPDTLKGGRGDDTLVGDDAVINPSTRSVVTYGNSAGGNDHISDSSGANFAAGGAGSDIIIGGSGMDIIYGHTPTGEGTERDEISGGLGNDQIFGQGGDDLLEGDDGNDAIFGGAGHDEILGGNGIDEIHGGDGNDNIQGGNDSDDLYGDAGDDYIDGGESSDEIFGGDGADVLIGGLGNDWIEGGAGNDAIIGDLNSTQQGATGNDTLFGGDGDDSIAGDNASVSVVINTINFIYGGGTGNDTIYGGSGEDILVGQGGIDELFGDAGEDELYGHSPTGAGDDSSGDTLHGGDDADTLYGQNGVDFLFGDAGDDLLYGGEDNDTLHGGLGSDRLEGQGGGDILNGDDDDDILIGGAGNDEINGGDGNDLIIGDLEQLFIGASGSDTINGGDGDDVVLGDHGLLNRIGLVVQISQSGGTGNDTISGGLGNDRLYGQGGVDIIDGGDGNDRIYGHRSDLVDDDLAADQLAGGNGNDEIHGNGGPDSIQGGDGNDLIYGDDGNDVIDAGSGNDTVFGGNDEDTISGDDGDDEIWGEAGDDIIEGDAGSDEIDGGTGDDDIFGHDLGNVGDDGAADFLVGSDGNDEIDGGAGPDKIWGGTGTDLIYGREGNDIIDGGGDVDTIFGNEGDDDIEGGDGNDVIEGNEGADTIHGGNGDDVIHGHSATNAGDDAAIDTIFGDDDDDLITGGAGPDVIEGNAGNDTIFGNEGDDQIHGGAGNDVIEGNEGADTIHGDAGDDTIHGHSASNAGDDSAVDTIFGDDDNDLITGGGGADVIEGNDGNDTIFGQDDDDDIQGQAGDDTIYGGSGMDGLDGGTEDDVIYGQDGDDVIFGRAGADEIYGGNGEDVIEGNEGDDYIEGNAGADLIHGGDDHDTIYGHSQSGVGDDAAIDTLHGDSGNDLIYGNAGDDFIDGGTGNDELHGNDGDDEIYGRDGDDLIFGDAGRDWISGGNDTDTVHGGAGNDFILGGSGNDELNGDAGEDSIDGQSGDDTISGGSGDDVLHGDAGQDEINGNGGEDALFGDDGDDTLRGNEGDDSLDGGNGVDLLFGGDGNDVLLAGTGIGNRLFGEDGDDLLIGADVGGATDFDFFDALLFGDVLDGGSGNDRIHGLGGADLIYGGAGDDVIDTGAGADLAFAGLGDDWVYAGYGGGDILRGDEDDDELWGSIDGATEIHGGTGNDFIRGGSGNDVLYGDEGHDDIDGGDGMNTIDGGEGDDTLRAGMGAGSILTGGIGHDILIGSAGGATTMDGGSGENIFYTQPGDTVTPGINDWEDAYANAPTAIAGTRAPPELVSENLPSDTASPVYPFAGLSQGTDFGEGASRGIAATDPAMIISPAGSIYLAWSDGRAGNFEIY
ncbi:MAG: LEPR-XLL domain-containing protein, partial [Verrucomicrobiae bacterium]|nr:LEPR-XLL domain-containing protein [Verrucomicrobiae bacterium]